MFHLIKERDVLLLPNPLPWAAMAPKPKIRVHVLLFVREPCFRCEGVSGH